MSFLSGLTALGDSESPAIHHVAPSHNSDCHSIVVRAVSVAQGGEQITDSSSFNAYVTLPGYDISWYNASPDCPSDLVARRNRSTQQCEFTPPAFRLSYGNRHLRLLYACAG